MTHHFLPALMLLASGLVAQTFNPPTSLDTLLQAHLQEDSLILLDIPNGNDTGWVNFDVDGKAQSCYAEDTYGWFIAPDAGEDEQTTENFAFTSCSWLENSGAVFPCPKKNRNWLITPPVYLNGAHADLDWKSLSRSGPAFLDGYVVLLSTTFNFPEYFTDTLFRAAEMIKQTASPNYNSLEPDDYLFSPGYIHANEYTDTSYYFENFDFSTNTPFLNGRFEPHHVNLSMYLNKTIYIAFVHNSDCDYILQLDDIVITDDSIVLAVNNPASVRKFEVYPNPSEGPAFFRYTLAEPETIRFSLSNALGQTVWTSPELHASELETTFQADFSRFPGGIYEVVLQTSTGLATRKLIKQ